jgi:hypothetical protein
METFKANTHYVDWKGTVSADDAHPHSVHEFLNGKGLIQAGEFLLSVSFFSTEKSFFVNALVLEGAGDYDEVEKYLAGHEGPIPVREVKVELTAEEFLDLFKEFNVVLTWQGLKLEGHEYSAKEALKVG